jgi:hypothetical protein
VKRYLIEGTRVDEELIGMHDCTWHLVDHIEERDVLRKITEGTMRVLG